MDSMYLMGSEAVQNAGNTMHSAADTIRQAAGSFSESVWQLQRALTEHAESVTVSVDRFEQLVVRIEAAVSKDRNDG
jgi:hypothetical protein